MTAMQATAVPSRTAVHGSFSIDRTYDASPARVFAAFADPKLKTQWFRGPAEWGEPEHSLDFRMGGEERNSGGPEGCPHTFQARYHDIVPNERIIYSYDMHLGDKLISVSLAIIEFKPAAKGTRLVITEHGAFLDGYDDAGSRERGTRGLLEQLAAFLG